MKILKTLALTLTALSLTVVTAVALESLSLKENMEHIGDLYKSIEKSMADASKNADNAKASAEINELFKAVDSQVPEVIKEMPAGDQTAAIQDYKGLISQAIELSKQMEEAFARNDNTAAADAHKKLKALRKQGHEKYRPE